MNYAWILEIRPGYEEEYKKRHDEIWPEMVQMLKEAGLRNYNIFRYGIMKVDIDPKTNFPYLLPLQMHLD